MKRHIEISTGDGFFEPGIPVYLNRVRESFSMYEHAHDFVEITYVCEGAGMHYIGHDTVQVSRGDLFFLPIGVSHVFRPVSPRNDRPLVVYNCLFPSEVLAELTRFYGMEPAIARLYEQLGAEQRWLKVHDRQEEAHRLFGSMFQEYTLRSPGFMPVLYADIVKLLVWMYRRWNRAGEPGSLPASAQLEELLWTIRRDCHLQYSVSEVSSTLNVGDRQFTRLFRKAAGMSFLEYVQNARIERSMDLLTSTVLTVREIALQTGYQDIKFFNRLFKKKTGLSPTQFRKQALGHASV
ncbi:AraC family transcriptional regulator [Paenibacillus gansuensis]|uniref:Helix-turn-helix domain-containing protein n=1 Tax=Paenibacillus gansuensis TaxID=306542 RepID=A0ABW5PFJ4_9BACL